VRVRAVARQGPGDTPGPGAQIDRRAGRRQALHGATREWLAVPAWHVDTGNDADLEAAERGAPGDPGQWLAREAASDERAEEVEIAGRAGPEIAGSRPGRC
jgi:hypothetical protein